MMNKLPFEVLLEIFEYLPLSNFKILYSIFPQDLIDEALVYKLKKQRTNPVVRIVSSNQNELSTSDNNHIPLYYRSYDVLHRHIWFMPDFTDTHYYFKVKDSYVSHGKLLIKNNSKSIALSSLWDIRKFFPPARAGSFSGASEFNNKQVQSKEITISQFNCILDGYLMSSSQKNIPLINQTEDSIKRPTLPSTYQRKVEPISNTPANNLSILPTFPDLTCGYFLVERLAIPIPALLDLY